MADPEFEWGLVFDAHGNLDIQRSPFFNAGFDSNDDTVGTYLDRILSTLIHVIEKQRPDSEWIIDSRPPALPSPVSSPATSPLGITCLLVASLSLLTILLR
ncbi:hypothetical protein MA16_Dca016459 [Dendrobium catenatum]|uniref:Uncharacterized protein n=1 Tax=Dendrobium catenatum TaxID=906689 RepID=A0A2I0VYN7_9ASPA|nr:hypothetical protein MA16_Dca016459 [Dendrobium catenatum]